MTTMAQLQTPCNPNWCPGCGNLALWSSFKMAAVQEGWNNTNTSYVAGIGCHGHIVNFTKITAVEGLHGRAIPVASGLKMANHALNVFVFTGDGDCLGEGGNHFIHACRRNHDITILLHDNGLYALTTGQTSPASPHGFKSKSTPDGNPDWPLNPLTLAISAGATFVARGFTGDMAQLKDLIVAANKHKGISVLDILQPCVTFNKTLSHEFYHNNTYYLDSTYDKTNKETAFKKSQEFGEKSVPLGILYEEDKPSYESQLSQLSQYPLVASNPIRKDLTDIFKKYM